jgi:hypothetical protein
MLGARAIDWNRPFTVYLSPLLSSDDRDKIDDFNNKEDWVKKYNLFKIGEMLNPSIESINSQTGMESDSCYEEMEYMPASAVIFSQQCPPTCWVKRDYEYSQYGTTPKGVKDTIKAGANTEYFNSEYWNLNYGFAPEFVQEEYDSYNLKTTPLTEDVIKVAGGDNAISAASTVNDKSTKHHMCGYGIMITTVHKDAPAKDWKSEQEIPVAYIEFDRFHDAKNGTMNIVWNNNGFLRLE